MKLAPGVKIGLTQRGNVRLGLGPRAARVHLGTGSGPSFSSGVGGLQYWSRPSARRRSRADQPAPVRASSQSLGSSIKAKGEAAMVGLALEAGVAIGSAAFHAVSDAIDARRERREDKASLIEALEIALVTAHLQSFPVSCRPEWRDPDPMDRTSIRRDHRDHALGSLGWWRVIRRSRAKREAAVAADAWCDAEDRHRLEVARKSFQRACELWPRLEHNHRETVVAVLEYAFEDNAMPAFAVDCQGSVASLAMVTGTSDTLPDEAVARDREGKASFVDRDDQLELHRDSVYSNLLATINEALAVAPFLTEVQVVCLERRESLVRKRDKLVPIGLVRATRDDMTDTSNQTRLTARIHTLSRARFELDDEAQGLRALDLDDEPEVELVVAEIADALDCRH